MMSAVTLLQSSQYHHLLFSFSQGGNGTQDNHVQPGQGVVVASPRRRIVSVIAIEASETITPKNRVKKCFVCAMKLSSMPKKSTESRSMVLSPHRKPYNMPPRSGNGWYKQNRVKCSAGERTIVVVNVWSQTDDQVQNDIEKKYNNDDSVAMLRAVLCDNITKQKPPVHNDVGQASSDEPYGTNKQFVRSISTIKICRYASYQRFLPKHRQK